MTTQLELGEAHARTSDPGTSHAAAKAVQGKMATELEAKVFNAVLIGAPYRGMTTHEIAKATGLEYGSVTPRIKPLVKKGLLWDSGIRRVPEGRSKAGIVWRAT